MNTFTKLTLYILAVTLLVSGAIWLDVRASVKQTGTPLHGSTKDVERLQPSAHVDNAPGAMTGAQVQPAATVEQLPFNVVMELN